MGILRRSPAGAGARLAEEVVASEECAAMERPGTVAARRPPEAARNCLRSIDELRGDDLLGDKSMGHESWGTDLMRVTSANAHRNRVRSAALYERCDSQTSTANRFSRVCLVMGGES